MAEENPTWGEERIAAELLLKLGLRVSGRTVRRTAGFADIRRVMPSRARPARLSTDVSGAKATLSAIFEPRDVCQASSAFGRTLYSCGFQYIWKAWKKLKNAIYRPSPLSNLAADSWRCRETFRPQPPM